MSAGKHGRRMIKLNSQAKEIVHNQKQLWNYTKNYVSHKFKSEVRCLGIKNVSRFKEDIWSKFIKQGMSIYKVSKLLGHKSVRTTEQHFLFLLLMLKISFAVNFTTATPIIAKRKITPIMINIELSSSSLEDVL